MFDGKPDNDGSDDGMGTCKGVCPFLCQTKNKTIKVILFQADMNYGLIGGTATWMGQGTWTASSQEPICIDFYDPDVSPLFYYIIERAFHNLTLYRMTSRPAVAS